MSVITFNAALVRAPPVDVTVEQKADAAAEADGGELNDGETNLDLPPPPQPPLPTPPAPPPALFVLPGDAEMNGDDKGS